VLSLSRPEPATASTQFTFLADCKARHEVVMGDGRLSLEREARRTSMSWRWMRFPANPFRAPAHSRGDGVILSPSEAGRILAVNISNRFVDLEPVVDGECRALGKIDRLVDTDGDESQDLNAATWCW